MAFLFKATEKRENKKNARKCMRIDKKNSRIEIWEEWIERNRRKMFPKKKSRYDQMIKTKIRKCRPFYGLTRITRLLLMDNVYVVKGS